jgi:hypothetical protein
MHAQVTPYAADSAGTTMLTAHAGQNPAASFAAAMWASVMLPAAVRPVPQPVPVHAYRDPAGNAVGHRAVTR